MRPTADLARTARADLAAAFAPTPGRGALGRGARMAAAPVTVLTPEHLRETASESETEYLAGVNLLREQAHPSRILREKSEAGWRLGELYDRMLEPDADLAGFWQKRQGAVMQLPRRIVPLDGTTRARETADFCQHALALVPGLAINLAHQIEAEIKGIAIDELVWERITRGPLTRAAVPVDVIDRPMWRFGFIAGALHIRRAKSLALEPVRPGKFLVHRTGSKDSPWGRPLLDHVYWASWLKKNAWKFYATYLDKWAQPTLLGQYKHRSSQTKGDEADKLNRAAVAKILEVIELLQAEYGAVIPQGTELKLLEAQRAGSATYEQFIALCTRAEALFMLGEIDTSGAAKGPGSFAKSEVSNGVRLERVRLDAHHLAAHLRDQLLRPMVELNFGLDWPVPRWQFDTLEAEDRAERREGIQLLLDNDLPVPERHFYQTAQCPEPEEGERVVRRPRTATGPTPPRPSPAPAPNPSPLRPAQELTDAA